MPSRATLPARAGVLVFAMVAYAAFAGVALWAILFLADRGPLPTVDGPAARPVWAAVAADLGLLGLFALQHSAMARAPVKERLARVVPTSAERSVYVAAASLVLALVFWRWRPVPGTIWDVGTTPAAPCLWSLYGAGWTVAVASTFMVDHLDFLGLRQALANLRGRAAPCPDFTERWLYAWIRHPMMLGLLVAFWATPTMTASHLLFATAASGYIAVGLRFEERDLRAQLGETYRDYAERVPSLVAAPRRLRSPSRRALPSRTGGDR